MIRPAGALGRPQPPDTRHDLKGVTEAMHRAKGGGHTLRIATWFMDSLPGTVPGTIGVGESALFRFQRALHDAFVRYNPLYFASALCVLSGVLIVSNELYAYAWTDSRPFLALTILAYEGLLIGAAALLIRSARLPRPAVILGLLELLFLFDATLQTEAICTHPRFGAVAAYMLAGLAVLKFEALTLVFRLRLPVLIRGVAWAVLGLIPVTPVVLLAAPLPQPILYLGALWLLASLLYSLLVSRAPLSCDEPLDAWGSTVLRRAGWATALLGILLSLGHALAWGVQFEIEASPPQLAPFVLLAAFAWRREWAVWAGAACAVALTWTEPQALAPVAGLVGACLLGMGWCCGTPRLYVASILALGLGVWISGWEGGTLPLIPVWLAVAVGSVLFILAWRRQTMLAGLASAAAFAVALTPWMSQLIPHSRMELGIALIGIGFLVLVIGVSVSWELRRRAI